MELIYEDSNFLITKNTCDDDELFIETKFVIGEKTKIRMSNYNNGIVFTTNGKLSAARYGDNLGFFLQAEEK